MSFLKRVFSADYRRGLAAEAANDYAAAARAYALAGERAKVAEMHLYLAERAGALDARLVELRAAVRWADADSDEGRRMRRRLGRALLDHVRRTGVLGDSDRALLAEAAALFASAGDHAGAGECHELAGDETAAAEAYQRAGELERLEAVLARDETRRLAQRKHRAAFDEYKLALAAGARDRARESLRAALDAQPDPQYRALLATLDGKLLRDGKAHLRIGDGASATDSLLVVGQFPLGLGRESTCTLALRDPGISRHHAEVLLDGERFLLRDAGSKNGTLLGGVRIAGELPLDGDGELALGDVCALRFHAAGGLLELEVTRGLDRGLRVLAGARALAVGGGAATLRFAEGRPLLEPAAGRRLVLNGVAAPSVQLVRGDHVEVLGDEGRVAIEVA